jgi:hypothetical protein
MLSIACIRGHCSLFLRNYAIKSCFISPRWFILACYTCILTLWLVTKTIPSLVEVSFRIREVGDVPWFESRFDGCALEGGGDAPPRGRLRFVQSAPKEPIINKYTLLPMTFVQKNSCTAIFNELPNNTVYICEDNIHPTCSWNWRSHHHTCTRTDHRMWNHFRKCHEYIHHSHKHLENKLQLFQ